MDFRVTKQIILCKVLSWNGSSEITKRDSRGKDVKMVNQCGFVLMNCHQMYIINTGSWNCVNFHNENDISIQNAESVEYYINRLNDNRKMFKFLFNSFPEFDSKILAFFSMFVKVF